MQQPTLPSISSPTLVAPNQVLLFSLLLAIDSMHYIFAALIKPWVAPPASGFYVLAISAIEVGLYAAVTGRLHWRSFWQHAWFYLAIGTLVGIGTIGSYTAVYYINAGVASLLGKMGTVFTVLFGVIWLREKLNLWQLVGGGVAVIGAAIIAFQPGEFLIWGSLLVVGGTFLYALHAVIVKRYGGEIEFVEFFFWRVAVTATVILLFSVGSDSFVWPAPTAWLLLLLAGTIDITISRSLYYLTMRKLPVSLHAILLTLSPVASILWTQLFFHTPPTMQQLIGGVGVIAGILLVTLKR